MAHRLRYHQAVFDLIGAEPLVSAERLAQLRELERQAGVAFPASIVEWFALENAGEVFAEHTTPDWLTDLAELGDPATLRQGYMYVAYENQGVVSWYARLTGADDPPVFDDRDSAGEDLAAAPWKFCSASFSDFILHKIAAGGLDFAADTLRLRADDRAPDDRDLAQLHAALSEGPRSEGAARRTYRFFNQHGRVSVGCERGEDGTWRGRWAVEAEAEAGLLALEGSIRGIGGLADSLAPRSEEPAAKAREEAVLARLRGGTAD